MTPKQIAELASNRNKAKVLALDDKMRNLPGADQGFVYSDAIAAMQNSEEHKAIFDIWQETGLYTVAHVQAMKSCYQSLKSDLLCVTLS